MIVDLNHGGASPFGPGKTAPVSLSSLLNPYIDEALAKAKAAEPKRLYIGASEIGDDCERRVVLNALDAERTPFAGRILRVFEMGHAFEALVADWLARAGFYLVTIDPKTGRQFEFQTADGLIQGHCDGQIIGAAPSLDGLIVSRINGGPDSYSMPAFPWLWENKALMAKSWNAIVKHGVQVATPKYYYQAQTYMGYFEPKSCLFTAINKDTAEIYHEMIPFVLESAQRASDRGVRIIRSLQAGDLPKRISKRRDYYKCKLCDFNKTCWEMADG